jgi:hypothetical protein
MANFDEINAQYSLYLDDQELVGRSRVEFFFRSVKKYLRRIRLFFIFVSLFALSVSNAYAGQDAAAACLVFLMSINHAVENIAKTTNDAPDRTPFTQELTLNCTAYKDANCPTNNRPKQCDSGDGSGTNNTGSKLQCNAQPWCTQKYGGGAGNGPAQAGAPQGAANLPSDQGQNGTTQAGSTVTASRAGGGPGRQFSNGPSNSTVTAPNGALNGTPPAGGAPAAQGGYQGGVQSGAGANQAIANGANGQNLGLAASSGAISATPTPNAGLQNTSVTPMADLAKETIQKFPGDSSPSGKPAAVDGSAASGGDGDRSLFERNHAALERAQSNGNVGGASPDRGATSPSPGPSANPTDSTGFNGQAGEAHPNATASGSNSAVGGAPQEVSGPSGANNPTQTTTSAAPDPSGAQSATNSNQPQVQPGVDGSQQAQSMATANAGPPNPGTDSDNPFENQGKLPSPAGLPDGYMKDPCSPDNNSVLDPSCHDQFFGDLDAPLSNGPDPKGDATLADPIDEDHPALQAGADVPDTELVHKKITVQAPPAASTPDIAQAPMSSPSNGYQGTARDSGVSASDLIGAANTALGIMGAMSSLSAIAQRNNSIPYVASRSPMATSPTPPSNYGGSTISGPRAGSSGGSGIKIDCSFTRTC